MTKRTVYDREYQRRLRLCEAMGFKMEEGVEPDSAMYIHRDYTGKHKFEAKHANRPEIVGYGETRAEALDEWERCLKMFIQIAEIEDDPKRPTEIVGTFHLK